jgi:hypothetical protein
MACHSKIRFLKKPGPEIVRIASIELLLTFLKTNTPTRVIEFNFQLLIAIYNLRPCIQVHASGVHKAAGLVLIITEC